MSVSEKKPIKEKLAEPQINPRQLAVYVAVQIIGVIQGMIPVLIGEDFNATWFIVSFVMDNVAYFGIMALRSVAEGDTEGKNKLMGIIGNFLTDALNIAKDTKTDNTDKIRAFERMLVWTIRELDELYKEEFKRFGDYIKATFFGAEPEPDTSKSEKIEQPQSSEN